MIIWILDPDLLIGVQFCIEGLGVQACFGKYIKHVISVFLWVLWPSKDLFSRIFLKDASGFVAGAVWETGEMIGSPGCVIFRR